MFPTISVRLSAQSPQSLVPPPGPTFHGRSSRSVLESCSASSWLSAPAHTTQASSPSCQSDGRHGGLLMLPPSAVRPLSERLRALVVLERGKGLAGGKGQHLWPYGNPRGYSPKPRVLPVSRILGSWSPLSIQDPA